ncbi:hypothetical protein PSTG_10055 [Puccinia striiformis f. sp. tritici PST-78]|uniref:Uncharacterized protein n=1 Tax=Puccinia striiformis f. sp. tritici PST-78 TaxID=1165861 RepID=A0A0L0VBK3_9BASI|nr:hypothetical protein PSTG_10055 [Puccinia striiformis f. sp. tritici PST-78]
MSSKARATFLFILSLGQVGLCFPPGQVTHVLDEPAEVISTRSVGDEPIDRLQQNGTPFSESGLEGPVDSPEVPGNVHHGGRDVYQPSPTHSHHSHHNLMAGYQFDQQPGKSRKLEESIQAKHQVIDLNLPPPQILHTGPSQYQCLPNGPSLSSNSDQGLDYIDQLIDLNFPPAQDLHTGPSQYHCLPNGPSLPSNSDQGLANHAQLAQNINSIQEKALDRKTEDLEWQDTLVNSLMYAPMRNFYNPLVKGYIDMLRRRYELLPHSDTKSFKTARISFGKLPVQLVEELFMSYETSDQLDNFYKHIAHEEAWHRNS